MSSIELGLAGLEALALPLCYDSHRMLILQSLKCFVLPVMCRNNITNCPWKNGCLAEQLGTKQTWYGQVRPWLRIYHAPRELEIRSTFAGKEPGSLRRVRPFQPGPRRRLRRPDAGPTPRPHQPEDQARCKVSVLLRDNSVESRDKVAQTRLQLLS